MIEALLDKHKIAHRTSGNDFVVTCLNPDHEDISPSMHIDKTTGLYNCFSCKTKGSLLTLLKLLGEPAPTRSMQLAVKIGLIHDKLDPSLIIDVILPEDRRQVTNYRNLKLSTLKDNNIFVVPEGTTYNELLDRVCVPIFYNKKVQFIEARSVGNNKPKYLRYPRHSSTDFILSENCGAPLLVLVEGIFDYLTLYDLGIMNVTPLFGLSFTYKKAKHIKDLGFMGVVNMLDNDEAGNKASSNIEKMCEYNKLIYKRFYTNTDPGDITEEQLPDMVVENKCTITGAYLL